MINKPLPRKEVDIFKVGNEGLTSAEITAIQLVWEGQASSDQQRTAMNVIIDKFAMADHLSFKEGSPDGGTFLAGRAYVGKLVRHTIRQKAGEPSE